MQSVLFTPTDTKIWKKRFTRHLAGVLGASPLSIQRKEKDIVRLGSSRTGMIRVYVTFR